MNKGELSNKEQLEERALSMKIPADLHQRLKLAAVREQKTIRDIIIELVEKWLTKKE